MFQNAKLLGFTLDCRYATDHNYMRRSTATNTSKDAVCGLSGTVSALTTGLSPRVVPISRNYDGNRSGINSQRACFYDG